MRFRRTLLRAVVAASVVSAMAALAQTTTRHAFIGRTLDVPTARFDASAWSGTAPLAVTFNASSTTDGGSPITSLTLQFGDGQSVTWSNTTQTQSHTYTSGGTFNACLTATNAQGTSSATCGAITVSGGATEWPIARFDASAWSGTAPLTVVFDPATTTGDPITSLTMQFGDGQSVTWSNKGQTQSHTYTSGGTYNACLTATNSQGTSNPTCGAITVTGGSATEWPIARFDASAWSGTAPLTVVFDPATTTGDPITSLTLQFGDGQSVTWSSKSQTQSHTYTTGGTYNACLTATNSMGTSNPTCGAITVTGGSATEWPIARFDASAWSGAAPLTVVFDPSSTTGQPITSLTMQFGDGQAVTWSSTSQTQSHTYTSAGNYSACLTATNSMGTSNPTCGTITVNGTTTGAPTAKLTASPTSGDAPLTVTFDASTSLDNGAPISNLTLQFGDGQSVQWTDKSQHQSHTYSSNGSYNASLIARNSIGTSAAASQSIQVGPVAQEGLAVPTFHSMSLYWNPPGTPGEDQIWIRYRRSTETTWRQGWHMWYDPRQSGLSLPYTFKARGSVVFLQPGTDYVFQFGIGNDPSSATWMAQTTGTTWPDPLPADANVVTVPAQSQPYIINTGGSATAYKVYDFGHNVIDLNAGNNGAQCVDVNASYVIVRNLVCKGAFQYGITIEPTIQNVVIEDSDISNWDNQQAQYVRADWGVTGADEVSAIGLMGHNQAIVIQRNKIHDPAYGSSPWNDNNDHPYGPSGIMIRTAIGQNVIRYNEIYSTLDKRHWLQDGISGEENFSDAGAPGADSDIYSNLIRNVFDDGIEAEGGGRNVRVWGNYINQTGTGVATTVAHFGPMYVFRNVVNRSQYHNFDSSCPDDDLPNNARLEGFKAYGPRDPAASNYGGGREYFFNNTLLQAPGSDVECPAGHPQQYPLGVGGGITGTDGQGLRETWSLNNILHVWLANQSSILVGSGGGSNLADYDLYNGLIDTRVESGYRNAAAEAGGFRTAPQYASGSGPDQGPDQGGNGVGNFQITGTGVGQGTPIENFTFDIDNTGLAAKSGIVIVTGRPTIGAHESGAPPMKFGIPAAQ